MKTRRHHNTTGLRQIRRGRTREQVAAMAKRLGVPYGAVDDVVPPPASMTVDYDPKPVLYLPNGTVLVRRPGF